MAPIAGTTLGVGDASIRNGPHLHACDRAGGRGDASTAGSVRRRAVRGTVARDLGTSGVTYREEPEYEREIRRRIKT